MGHYQLILLMCENTKEDFNQLHFFLNPSDSVLPSLSLNTGKAFPGGNREAPSSIPCPQTQHTQWLCPQVAVVALS